MATEAKKTWSDPHAACTAFSRAVSSFLRMQIENAMTLPYMALFVDDFEAATPHLTLEEDGAYNRLLRLCWRTPGCSVPDDAEWIARKLRVTSAQYERVIVPILAEYFTKRRNRLFQKRQREVFAEAKALSQSRSDAGKKGAAAKSLKSNDNGSGKADGLLKQNSGKASASKTKTKTKEEPLSPLKKGASHNGSKRGRKRDVVPFREIGRMLEDEEAERGE